MNRNKEQVDHKAEALRLLVEAAGKLACDGPEYAANVKEALVHSNLAIAEGQERVAEEIKAFRELMAGSAT